MAVCTERKVRVELTPEPRALFAFVGPVGRVGRRCPDRVLICGAGSLSSCAQTKGFRSITIVNPTVFAISFFTTCLFHQFPSRFANSNTPAFAPIIFCPVVIVLTLFVKGRLCRTVR